MQISPDELLSLVRAAQFEVSMRRVLMSMHDTKPAARASHAERMDSLRQWLTRNNFDDMQ